MIYREEEPRSANIDVWLRHCKLDPNLLPKGQWMVLDPLEVQIKLLNWTFRYWMPLLCHRTKMRLSISDRRRGWAKIYRDLPELTWENRASFAFPVNQELERYWKPAKEVRDALVRMLARFQTFTLVREYATPWPAVIMSLNDFSTAAYRSQFAPKYAIAALAWHFVGRMDGLEDLARSMVKDPHVVDWVHDRIPPEFQVVPEGDLFYWSGQGYSFFDGGYNTSKPLDEAALLESVSLAALGYGESFLEPYRRHYQAQRLERAMRIACRE